MALLDKMIWQIETKLGEDITLIGLSQNCAVSTYHMCRMFQHGTGMSIMSYVRARRLSRAAQTIAAGEGSLINVALDAGYSSHEAFTRAFASYFNVLPSTIRTARSLSTLSLMEPWKMKQNMLVDVAKPNILDRDAFQVVGLSAICSFENTAAIPGLWHSFNAKEGEIDQAVPGATYGVCCDMDQTGHFRYVAGIEATGKTAGMDVVQIPAGKYAVFTHTGHVSDLPKTVYTIWNKSLPDYGLEPMKAPDFECYDSRFDPETGRGTVEIWLPISQRSVDVEADVRKDRR